MPKPRPCIDRHPSPVPAACDHCWLFTYDAKYRTHWQGEGPPLPWDMHTPPRPGGAGAPPPVARPSRRAPDKPACRHEGPVATYGLTDSCHVRQCLHDAADWDLCTRGPNNRSVQSCRNCRLYEKPLPPPLAPLADRRHLLYHVYPVSGNGVWQWHVKELAARWRCFNGKKLVAIVTDPPGGRRPEYRGPFAPDGYRDIRGCDSAATVREAFAAAGVADAEFLELENDPRLREVVSLVPLLERLKGETGATLYAQAKGTTRPGGHVARRWAEAQYEVYLDHWPLAVDQLRYFPVTGAFKKLGPGWHPSQSKSDWHYSGSWFWFRPDELFARDWCKVDQFWSGIEPYPSQQFLAAEAGCMFLEDQVPRLNLYNHAYWNRTVVPGLNRFREDNAKHRVT